MPIVRRRPQSPLGKALERVARRTRRQCAALAAGGHRPIECGRSAAGAVSINDAGLTAQVSDVEKDSFGVSGVGRSRMGASGLLRFLRKQALLVQTGQPAPMDAFQERDSSG